MLYTKHESSGPCSFRQEDFWKCIWKPIFWPCDLLMQPITTIWTILEGDHPETIPVEFGQITISGSRDNVNWTFPYIIQCKIVNNFGRGTPRDHSCEVWSKSNEWFQGRRCLSKKIFCKHLEDSCFNMLFLKLFFYIKHLLTAFLVLC